MYNLRILSKGRITDLSQGFSLGGIPFSVFIRPLSVGMDHTVINCKLLCDQQSGNFPVPIGDWTPGAIVSISPNAIDLNDYEVYWGAGEQIK